MTHQSRPDMRSRRPIGLSLCFCLSVKITNPDTQCECCPACNVVNRQCAKKRIVQAVGQFRDNFVECHRRAEVYQAVSTRLARNGRPVSGSGRWQSRPNGVILEPQSTRGEIR